VLRYLPAGLEVLGFIVATAGAYLLNPALGLVAGGLSAVVVGYTLEDAK
jgi:hypothetical protein